MAAPARFVAALTRKAGSAGASVTAIPTSLRLSQICLCRRIARKPLSERIHSCACGIIVQRDVFSAYLARFVVTVDGPAGLSWWLDTDQARAAWSGAESRLPTASRSVSVQAFVAWARDQSASGRPLGGAYLQPTVEGRSERIVGADGTMVRKGQDGLVHNVPRERGAREPVQSASGCLQNPLDVSVG